MKTKKCKVIAASITGPAHSQKKQSCQDYCRYAVDGRNIVAAVADGAGSAKFGKIGARLICDTVVDLLKNADFAKVRPTVKRAVEVARQKAMLHRFNRSKSEKHLDDFSATLVGFVYNRGRGMFFHIGDGAALALNCSGQYTASLPENGNFRCETYFYTMPDWKENLRFTSFSEAQAVFLMSDGVSNFAFHRDYREPEKNFIEPIHDFLCNEPHKRRAVRALSNTLRTARAQRLNSDDKTLLWAQL